MDAIRPENKENRKQSSKITMAANPGKRVGLSTRIAITNKGRQPLGASNKLNKLNVNIDVDSKIKNVDEKGFTADCSKENCKNLVNPIVPLVAQFEALKLNEDDAYDERMARIEEKLKNKVKKAGIVQVYKGTAEDRFYTKREVAELERKKREEEAAAKKSDLLLAPVSSPMSAEKTNDENLAKTDDSLFWDRKSTDDIFFEMEDYRELIYKYLREHELRHRPRSGYMKKQPHVTSNMRTILVDWLVEVAEAYRLSTQTLYLAVNFIDRFLSYMSVVGSTLQLVGTGAMFLASKYEEIYRPGIREFVYITDDTYTTRQVILMEQLLLKVLGFDLSVSTPLAFITAICSMNKISEKTIYLAMYLSELSLLNGDVYLEFLPSAIAASAIAIARHTLAEQHCWTTQLAETTGYELVDLRPCIDFLSGMFTSAQTMPQHAIQEKYKKDRYLHVSLLRPLNEPILFTY